MAKHADKGGQTGKDSPPKRDDTGTTWKERSPDSKEAGSSKGGSGKDDTGWVLKGRSADARRDSGAKPGKGRDDAGTTFKRSR